MPTKANNAEMARRIMPVPDITTGERYHNPPKGVFVMAWSGGADRFHGRPWTKMLTIDETDNVRLYLEFTHLVNGEFEPGGWHEQPTCVAEITGYLWSLGAEGEKNNDDG